jgi:hypothetical protein
MANYDTGKDIVEDMLSRAGELRLGAAELSEEAKRYANRGYFNVIRQFQWLWAERYPPLVIATPRPQRVMVDVRTGSAAIDADTVVAVHAGAKIVLDRDGIPFRILAGGASPNVAVIGVPYPFESADDLPGYIYKDEFNTPDVLVASRIKNISQPYRHIDIVGYEEMDERMPLGIPFGPISMASYYHEDWLRLGKAPENPEVLELHCTVRPPPLDFSGSLVTDVPILPVDERWLVADYGLYFLMVDHGDDRAGEVAQIAAGRVAEIKDRQIAKMSPRIYLPDAFSIMVE